VMEQDGKDPIKGAWMRVVALAMKPGEAPSEKNTRWLCPLCDFGPDLPKSMPREDKSAMAVQHLRAVHRHVYLNMLEMVYDSQVRGIPLFSGYVASRDELTLALVSLEASKGEDDRHLRCVMCGYSLAYRGRRHKDDWEVDAMMAAHMKVCHREEWHEARSVAMGAENVGGEQK